MSRYCPHCGSEVGDSFARCPSCGFDLSTLAAGEGKGENAPTGGTGSAAEEWGKTVIESTAPRGGAGRPSRFDRGREFYEPVDATRSGLARPDESATGDHTIIERQRGDVPEDATVIVRGGRRGVTGPLAYIVEMSGVRAGKVHLLRGETTIGRAPDNDITLGDDSVSRRHAKIRVEDGAFAYWDLASANYSFVVAADGSRARMLEPRKLVDGDKIDLGEARVCFILVDPGEASDAS